MAEIKYYFDNEQILNRLFVLYGNTTDCYQTVSRPFLSFDRLLESHLMFLGYEVILFYRGGNILECFHESIIRKVNEAFLSEGRNRSEEEEREESGDQSEKQDGEKKAAAAPTKAADRLSRRLPGIKIARGETAAASASKVRKTEEKKQINRLNIKEEKIPAFLNQVMRERTVKSCVVFTNCWQIFENANDKVNKEIASYMSSWYSLPVENNNIGILLFNEPRLGSLGEFLHNKGSWAFLYERLFHNQKPTEAVIRIGPPHMDEVRYMLESFFTDVLVTDDMEQAAISLVQEQGGRLQALRKYLQEKRFLSSSERRNGKGATRPQQEIAELLVKEHGIGSQEDALEKIRTTEGWEEIYALVARLIEEKDSQPKRREEFPMNNWTVQRMTIQQESQNHGINMSIMLKGNPGTGKTTVTKWIGLALQQHGLLPVGKVIKVAKQDLEAGYVGQSAIRTQDKINEAAGSVLFVDEAYALFRQEDDGRASFGRDVIDVFVDQMTSRMGELAFVFAGYPEPMDHFMTANPGLMRRFGDNVVTIPDYTPEVLERIALTSIEKVDTKGAASAASSENVRRFEYVFGSDLIYGADTPHEKRQIPAQEAIEIIRKLRAKGEQLGPISHYFNNWYADRDRTSFGNAGSALQLAESICHRARQRTGASRGKIEITAQDFPEGTEHLFVCRKPSVSEIKKQMADVIGMQSVKDSLIRITNYLQLTLVQNARRASRTHTVPSRVEPGHYLFIGNPGTGKTMISEKLALTLSGLGIIEKYQPVRVTGLELMNMLTEVNGANKLKKYIETCNGGVLVIDEAHQFVDDAYHGRMAVKALLDPLIEYRESMSIVFCCYPEYVDAFLKIEPGLARRINEIMRFEDYTPEEILEIFLLKAEKQGYQVSEECRKLILTEVDRMAKEKRTQNGGTAEKLLREIKVSMGQRIAEEYEDVRSLETALTGMDSEEENSLLYTVTEEDIQEAVERLTDYESARRGSERNHGYAF